MSKKIQLKNYPPNMMILVIYQDRFLYIIFQNILKIILLLKVKEY